MDLAASIQNALLGRNRRTWYTAQSGQHATEKFLEMVELWESCGIRQLAPKARRSNGSAGLPFVNGSKFRPFAPVEGALDGKQAHKVSLDEFWYWTSAQYAILRQSFNAKLAAMGMADLEGEAAKAATTEATLALLTEQTADATGQFSRELGTAAGAQQVANAKWEDAQAALGEVLLPIMADFAGMLAEVAGWVSENTGLVTGIATAVGIFAGAILVANGAISAYRTIAAIATAAQIAWNVAMSANPLGMIILAIGAVIAAIVWLIANWEEVGRIAGEVWDNIVAAIETAIGWIGSLFGAADNAGGGSSTGGSFRGPAPASGPAPAPQVMSLSAASIAPASSSVSSGGGWSAWAASSSPVTREGDTNITVNGAIDSDGTARTIEKVLNKRQDRTGRTPAFAGGDSRWR